MRCLSSVPEARDNRMHGHSTPLRTFPASPRLESTEELLGADNQINQSWAILTALKKNSLNKTKLHPKLTLLVSLEIRWVHYLDPSHSSAVIL